jgi:hypothetical protein
MYPQLKNITQPMIVPHTVVEPNGELGVAYTYVMPPPAPAASTKAPPSTPATAPQMKPPKAEHKTMKIVRIMMPADSGDDNNENEEEDSSDEPQKDDAAHPDREDDDTPDGGDDNYDSSIIQIDSGGKSGVPKAQENANISASMADIAAKSAGNRDKFKMLKRQFEKTFAAQERVQEEEIKELGISASIADANTADSKVTHASTQSLIRRGESTNHPHHPQ